MMIGIRSMATAAAFAAGLALAAPPAQAGTITPYIGQDDGAPIGGPFPSSVAAEAAFLAGAGTFGPISTNHGFGSQPLGFNTNNVWFNGDGTFTLAAPNFGAGFSGISDTTFGNLYGFNVGSGTKWLGFPGGSATFNNASPTHSFGAFFTGLQTILTGANDLAITFNDGTNQTLYVTPNQNGGAQYFGFTDTDPFSSITITNLTSDAWGLDNIRFNIASAATPLPGALPLFCTGLGLLGLLGWRRKRKKAATLAA